MTAADLANPEIDALTLHNIAQARPDLWPLVTQHPNSYEALNAWIAQQQAAHLSVAPAGASAAGFPQPSNTANTAYPQPVYPQPVAQGYAAAPGQYAAPAQPGMYPVVPGAYLPRKAKGSALGPVLMFVSALVFLVTGGLPAATSPRGTVDLVDLDVPFTFSALAWFALLISSIVVWILRTRGALTTGAIFGIVCGGTWAFVGIANAIAASAAGWQLGVGFFALAATGAIAIVGGVLALLNRPKSTYV